MAASLRLLTLLAGLALALAASAEEIVSEEYTITAADPDVALFVRNKRPASLTAFSAERIVLFVHGATYPAETSFDLAVEGESWMEYIARRGYDVYLMDVRGYGRSTRPPEMSAAPQAHSPISTTDVAVRDFGAVVDHIRARRNVERINVMGWSWGTVTTGAFAAANPGKVARVVLFAPLWLRDGASPINVSGDLGAYRTVTREAAVARWLSGVPEDRRNELIPAGVLNDWWAANMEADPAGAAEDPPVIRAPNGVLEDGRRYWSAGRPYYDPARIRAPVLLVHGEWDVDTPAHMSQALFAQLANAPVKRYVVIGASTHTLLLEANRDQLHREVQLFLDEGLPDS